jgi:hypothetical protein
MTFTGDDDGNNLQRFGHPKWHEQQKQRLVRAQLLNTTAKTSPYAQFTLDRGVGHKRHAEDRWLF